MTERRAMTKTVAKAVMMCPCFLSTTPLIIDPLSIQAQCLLAYSLFQVASKNSWFQCGKERDEERTSYHMNRENEPRYFWHPDLPNWVP